MWIVALLVLGGAVAAAAADCGCSKSVEPSCYVTFRTNELISFSTVFPVDYFVVHSTTETPFVLGWMVAAADGSVVRSVVFPDIVGWLQEFVWDLTDEDGLDVGPGFYTITISTTAGPVTANVRLVSCCEPCLACWSCCVCTTCPTAGGLCPCTFGEPYLVLDVSSTKNCCAFTFQLYGEWGTP
jgi:hypothetical protein